MSHLIQFPVETSNLTLKMLLATIVSEKVEHNNDLLERIEKTCAMTSHGLQQASQLFPCVLFVIHAFSPLSYTHTGARRTH